MPPATGFAAGGCRLPAMARNAPRPHLKAVDGLLEPAVAETVEALQIGSADVAVARLALLLATASHSPPTGPSTRPYLAASAYQHIYGNETGDTDA